MLCSRQIRPFKRFWKRRSVSVTAIDDCSALLKRISDIAARTCQYAPAIAAGKIDAANAAEPRMRTVSRSSHIVITVENIFAMAATTYAIVDDERHDNGTGGALAIRNVLCPGLRSYSITTHSSSRIAAIAAMMADGPGSLLTTMIRRG